MWKPSANLFVLQTRAKLYRLIRDFFDNRQLLEVEVPILGVGACVEPYIDSLQTVVNGEDRFLQTSPEFYLKRLLAADIGPIYSLSKAFRDGEKGKLHSPEFTLLEWYRPGWDERQLMEEVADLLALIFPSIPRVDYTYRDIFLTVIGIDPHTASLNELQQAVESRIAIKLEPIEPEKQQRNRYFDLLMSHCIEPVLPEGLVFIYDYPSTQSTLAKIEVDNTGVNVTRRFEAYLTGIELANGYLELTDASEQLERFRSDQAFRHRQNLPLFPCDQQLIAALESGMPAAAGVALGIDRLLMAMTGVKDIQSVLSF
jgi:elongation factor P--(R)-beta-lysine ligase